MILNSTRAMGCLILASAFALPSVSQAANYKCTVDGKTEYQDRPCAGEVVKHGTQNRIEVPVGGPSAVMMRSPAQTATLRLQVEKEGVPKIREAFESLKAGNHGQYLTHLCPKARSVFQTAPAMMADLKSQGTKYARDQVRITGLHEVTAYRVSFTAEGAAAKEGQLPTVQMLLTGDIDWDLGKPCVSRMGVVRR